MRFRLMRSALALVLLATLATACGGGSEPSSSGSDPTAEPTGGGAPAPEGTGTEQPAPGGQGGPAIELAGAPAGGSDQGRNPDGSHCITVIWQGDPLGASLGNGLTFQVTEVRLTGAKPAGYTCGQPSCQGYTFVSNDSACSYAVRPGTTGGTLAAFGNVLCAEGVSAQACQSFRSKLKVQTLKIEPEPHASEQPQPSEEPEPSEDPQPSEEPEGTDAPQSPEEE